MKCLILAAGYGSRLGSLTKDKPKSLIDLDGKPLIEHILTRLAMHGIHDVVVNLHYLPNLVSGYLHERVLYYYEPKLLGHERTIKNLRNWLGGESFMVVNADTITNLDYTDMITFHKFHPEMITAAMDEYRSVGSWIYPACYFERPTAIRPYRPKSLFWKDAGTPERLAELEQQLKE